jgi:hypothetical protein
MKPILTKLVSTILIALSLCVIVANGQGEDDAVIRVETHLVNLFFSAIDKDKRFMTSLERSDLAVYEDGVRQEILTFQDVNKKSEGKRPIGLLPVVQKS